MPPNISVLIATRGRTRALKACLESIAAADLSGVLEVLVLINGADRASADVATSFSTKLPGLKVLELARPNRGGARNRLARAARGKYLYFLDDDVTVPAGLFAAFSEISSFHPDAWGFGGPNLTPASAGRFERAAGRLHETKLGAWAMRERYSPAAEGWASDRSFMLCNLAIERGVFDERGLSFDERLVSAEENLLIARARDMGGRFFYSPRLSVFHERRGTLLDLSNQIFKCGAGRYQVCRLYPRAFSVLFILPAAFLAVLLQTALAGPGPLTGLGLLLYLVAAAWEAYLFGREEKSAASGLLLLALIPTAHAAYGAGFLLGSFRWIEPLRE
jgi:GT2 family glycosyltransferase